MIIQVFIKRRFVSLLWRQLSWPKKSQRRLQTKSFSNTERSSHTRANYEVVCISKNILFRDERERDGLWIEKHQLWHRTGWILWSNQAQCRRQSSLLTAGEQEMFKGTEQAVVFLTILLIYFHPTPTGTPDVRLAISVERRSYTAWNIKGNKCYAPVTSASSSPSKDHWWAQRQVDLLIGRYFLQIVQWYTHNY